MSEITNSEILSGLSGVDIDESRFVLPTEREFNINAVDKTYIDKLKKYMDELYKKSENKDPYQAAFYIETPPVTTTGSYSDYGIHFIKAKICDSSLEESLNTFDGNTIPIKLSSISCGDSDNATKIRNITVDSWKQFTTRYGEALKPDRFDVKLVGIDAPSLPRWGRDKFDNDIEVKTMGVETLKTQGNEYIWEKSAAYESGAKLNFISINSGKLNSSGTGGVHWHQCRGVEQENDGQIIEWLINDGANYDNDYSTAKKAREALLSGIAAGDGDIYIVMDDIYLNRKEEKQLPSMFSGDIYDTSFMSQLRLLADKLIDHNDYVTTGFNQFGLDKYGRAMGAVYVKTPKDGTWINLAKYVIAALGGTKDADGNTVSLQDLSQEKQLSSQFAVYTYDYKNRVYADAMKKLNNETDDRWRIQAGVLQKKKNELRDWTVMLGDCLFMIPPTSIRCATQTTEERIPVMRSRGSMVKGSTKAERILELDLYFSEDGINGVELEEKQKTPSGESVTYKMNGLRQLLAQFYFMPFLPIENAYINEVLNVEAVALAGLQISTVPGFPKLAHAIITLQEFDYRVYMPELPTHYLNDNEYCNYFASAINWPLARWYYQRAIMRGDISDVAMEKLDKYEQKRIRFKPMKFESDKISFQIVSEDHLKKLMQLKQEMHKMVARGDTALIKMSKGEQELVTDIGSIARAVDLGMLDSEYLSLMAKPMSPEGTSQNMEQAMKIVAGYIEKVNDKNNTNIVKSVVVRIINSGKSDSQVSGQIAIKALPDYLANTDDAISRLRSSASNHVGTDNSSFYKNGMLYINFIKKFDAEGNVTFGGVNTKDMADYQFAAYCYNKEVVEEDFDEIKTDYPFLDYDYGNATVELISANFSNVVSRLGVSGSDGFAPQYMGAQDTVIDISFATTDVTAVQLLNMLPRVSAYYVREYRQVMSFSPLKISSEFTDLLGLSEVIVENVLVETVPGFPGKYTINMRLLSVDRTARRKEALMKIEGTNSGYQRDETRTVINTKGYFELEHTLRQAEVYPDLELPTLQELKKSGFYFLRYIIDDERWFPDPDFYFVYAYKLSSEFTRQAVLENIQKGNGEQFASSLIDKAGGKVDVEPDKSAPKVVKRNGISEKAVERMQRVEEVRRKAKEEETNIKNATDVSMEDFLKQYGPTSNWNIGGAYMVSLLEPRFKKAMQVNRADDNKKQWLQTVAQDMRDAAKIIDTYLTTTPIEDISIYSSELAGAPIENIEEAFLTAPYGVMNDVAEAMKKLSINYAGNIDFQNSLKKLLYSCACAMTGEKEYSKNKSKDWMPRSVAISINSNKQDKQYAGSVSVNKDTDPTTLGNVKEFGCFGIKAYEQNQLFSVCGQWGSYAGRKLFVLDPYYRNADEETLGQYKKNCILSENYCAKAFMRNLLYWFTVAIDYMFLPSITYDVMRKDLDKEIKAINIVGTLMARDTDSTTEKHLQFLKDNSEKLDAGKFFLCACMALCDREKSLMTMISKRDYSGLNGLIQSCASPSVKTSKEDALSFRIRRLVMALIGCEAIKGFERLTSKSEAPIISELNETLENKYLEAAEDPMQFAKDSFFDMVTTDMRGRMARAFPVIYMLFIDEGREFGVWKLHDNFYNTNAISSVEIIKSRKNPADTAHIILSNLYGTYTTEDENTLINYQPDYWDVFRSIWSPREQFLKDEAQRRSVAPARRAKLEPGTRIHLRMGYSSNAARLPVLFNGMVTEVEAGECVELIAQGDGIELLHQILNVEDEDSLLDQDKLVGAFFRRGASPKEIMAKLFAVKGGWMKNKLADNSWMPFSDWAFASNKNPYGLFHFGDPDYKEIFASGEIMQNTYEALDRPGFQTSTGDGGIEFKGVEEEYAFGGDSAPRISCDVYGKTVWDVLNICRSVSPDYILGIAPFAFRSTVFHGAPQYYYAYDYEQIEEGGIIEKRKPYQQWHILTSFSDIVKNGITASSKDVKTCAVGLYKRGETFGSETNQKVGPLWVDFDIYPEDQRTMTVDTQLFGKQTPVAGRVIGYLDTLIDNMADEKGRVQSPYALAWRMTASALKESVQNMYQGEMVIIGDPSIKPLDRLFISDLYENMNGQCLVREVVHQFSLDTGFSTVITPDAIATVDDPQEINRQSICSAIATVSVGLHGLAIYGAACYGSRFIAPFSVNGKKLITKGKEAVTSTGKKLSAEVADSKWAQNLIKKTVTNLDNVLTKTDDIVEGAKVAKKVGQTAVTVGKAGWKLAATAAVLGPAAIALLPAFATALISYAVWTTVCKLADTALERWAKNLQVLQIYPLHRNGMVLTAGVNGSMGLVVGSPTYNMAGTFKSTLASISKTTEFEEGDNATLGIINSLLFSNELLDIGSKFRRDNNLIDDYGKPVVSEDGMLRLINNMRSSQTYATNSALKHALTAKVTTTDEMKKAIQKEGILAGEKDIKLNARIFDENYPVITHEELHKQYQDQFFHILHEECVYDGDFEIPVMVNGTVRGIRGFMEEKNGETIYDIPALKPDARDFLALVVRTTRELTSNWTQIDQRENSKTSFVILKSALRIGSKKTAASTGRVFILQGLGKCQETLPQAVQKILDTNNEVSSKSNGAATKNVFLIDKLTGSDGKETGDIRLTLKMDLVWDNTNSEYNKDKPAEAVASASPSGEHAILSPSSAKMWINCTPSAMKNNNYTDIAGKAAAEGTAAHALAAWKVDRLTTDSATVPPMTTEYYNEEMEKATDVYYEYVRSLWKAAKARDNNAVILTEQSLSMADYVPGGFGTGDLMIFSNGVLDIVDFKYGESVEVEAKGNPQMWLYALGALAGPASGYSVNTVHMAIVQPRSADAGIKEGDTMDAADLIDWGKNTLAPIAQKAYSGEGDEKAGSWCIFCNAKHECEAWKAERIY